MSITAIAGSVNYACSPPSDCLCGICPVNLSVVYRFVRSVCVYARWGFLVVWVFIKHARRVVEGTGPHAKQPWNAAGSAVPQPHDPITAPLKPAYPITPPRGAIHQSQPSQVRWKVMTVLRTDSWKKSRKIIPSGGPQVPELMIRSALSKVNERKKPHTA